MVDERQAALEDIRHRFDPAFYAKLGPVVALRLAHFVREALVHEPAARQEYKDDGSVLCYSCVHKSQLDYLLLGLELFHAGWPAPRYVAGKNLFIPGITKMFLKKMGAICLDRERILRRDRVYIRSFAEYLRDHVLGRGEHLLFFPEGGRSYDGRIGAPATGVYDTILEATERTDRRMLLVPVALTYDGVVEAASFPLLQRSRSMKSIWRRKLIYYFVDLGQILLHYFRDDVFCGDVHIDVLPAIDARPFAGDRHGKRHLAEEARRAQLRAARVTTRSLLATAFAEDDRGRRDEVEARLGDLLAEIRDRDLPVSRSLAPLVRPGIEPSRVLRACVATSGKNVVVDDGSLLVKRPAILRYYRNTIAHHF